MSETVARRHEGICKDCGLTRPVRTITFWLNAMRYQVCAACEKQYRKVILWPVTEG